MEHRIDPQQASGLDVLRWFSSGATEVAAHRRYLNLINVFPVADGDTGTNLTVTLRAMVERSEPDPSFASMLNAISRSGLESARGNSGILFASYVNGLALESNPYERVSVREFARIAFAAVRHLYQAVEHPQEGTILSVIRDWAAYLNGNSERFLSFQELFESACNAARASLERTREQLSVLRRHNVVDSGAAGFVRFLEGINRVFSDGRPSFVAEEPSEVPAAFEEETPAYRYCTEARVALGESAGESAEAVAEAVRQALAPFGDSLIVTPRGQQLKLHLHTDRPDLVMELLEGFGEILEQKADDMTLQAALRSQPVGGIGLVTDSIADLPDEFLLQNRVSVLPLGVLVHGAAYLDKVTIRLKRLFTEMDRRGDYPTSSQPEPARIRALLAARLEQFDSLIVLSVAEPLSGTYQALAQAARELETPEKRITVINTRLNSGAQGLMVKLAADLIREGKPHDAVLQAIESHIPRTNIYVCLNTLAYAVRGGRVPNTVGRLGMALGLRPIMTLDAKGHGAAFGAAFSQEGLTRRIMRLVKVAVRRGGIEMYSIVHGGNLPLAEAYRDQIRALTGLEPAFISEISSAVALHAGPGTVAVCLTRKER